jgi:hypothetical protein
MAFFCTQTGARIMAPGIVTAAGGKIPAFEDTAEHRAAENAALQALAATRSSPFEPPGPKAIDAAGIAALGMLRAPEPPAKPGPKPTAGAPERQRKGDAPAEHS